MQGDATKSREMAKNLAPDWHQGRFFSLPFLCSHAHVRPFAAETAGRSCVTMGFNSLETIPAPKWTHLFSLSSAPR
jgi:hypothetical protein